MLRMIGTVVLAGAVACGGSPQPAKPAPAPPVAVDAGPPADAAPLDQDLERLAQRSLAMYQDVAKALADSGADCKTAAARLDQLAGVYRDVATANTKVLKDGRAKELRAALDPHNEKFDRAAQAIMQSPTMSKCAQDRAFARAFDHLYEAPP